MTADGAPVRRPCWSRAAGIYLCLALIGGLTLLVVTPPMQVPDEWAHLERAYSLANGVWVGEGMGGFVPDQLHRLVWETENRIGRPSKEPVAPARMLEHLRELSEVSLADPKPLFVPFPTALYSPVPYAGMSAAIVVAQNLSDKSLLIFYAGRVGALLAAVLLSLWAIGIAPFGKWFFALLALTPVALFQSSGMSADGMTTALALLLAALVMRAGYGVATVGGTQVLLLALTASALSSCKQGYLLMSLMVWLIPKERFASTGHRRAARFGVPVLAATAVAGWTVLALRHHYTPPRPGTDALAQLSFIVSQPLDFLRVLGRDLAQNSLKYLGDMIATVGYRDIPGAPLVALAHIAALWLAARHDGPEAGAIGVVRKLCAFLLLAGGVAWIMTLLYLWWTPVGGRYVDGMQGRYFLPLLVLLPFVIGGRVSMRQHLREERWAVFLLWFWGGFLVANTAVRVVSHYYVV